MAQTIEDVVAQLRRDPHHPVRTTIAGLEVEVHVVAERTIGQSAADVFASLGPWSGETTEEILDILSEARRGGGRRSVADL